MAKEIERKFLVDLTQWAKADKPKGINYCQGYLYSDKKKSIRVRSTETAGFVTIKGKPSGITRLEYEYEIPLQEANELLENFADVVIAKLRYKVPFEGKVWEVDEFLGDNAGLVTAEIELLNEQESFKLPPWITEEVSDDERYYNANLAVNPFKNW